MSQAGFTRPSKLARTFAAAMSVIMAAACADAATGVEDRAPDAAEATPAITTTGYTAVVGDDWKAYQTKDQLKAAGLFSWLRTEDVYDHVDLVSDPTFGQVARIKFQQSDQTGFAPRMQKQFPQPLGHMWFRWRIKYVPGWTTVGPNPAGYANSWKMAFWTWKDYYARGAIQLSNGDQNIMEWGVLDPSSGQWYSYSEQVLPGSSGQPLGSVGDAWQNGEWYEYVVHYHRTSSTQAKQEYWYRRLTRSGAISNEPYIYHGAVFTGSPMPLSDGIQLGVNKNKSNPTTMYLMWGPWEVVDGSVYPNPFNMPSQGATTPPAATLTRVDVTPDTATLAPSATRQLTATGRYSDGTSRAVTVAWSASGGTVSSAGLYTAPAAAGTYLVIGREAASGLADTARITVRAATAATLQQVIVTPATASVPTGGTVQLSAQGRYSDGTTKAVAVTWSATGGTVSTAGLYTAGSTAGGYRAVAVAQGSALADTTALTVTAPPPAGSYTRLLGDDWRSYTSKTALSAYWSSADLANVDLVSDPTFGQVVRLTHRAGSTASPRLTRSLPAPASRVWYRWRVKYAPGWSTGGGAWTLGQLTWSGYSGVASAGVSGTSHLLGFNVRDASTYAYLRYSESRLAGSTTWGSVASAFGDSQWYEYVLLWEKTGATTGRAHWWTRRLTTGGTVVNNPWQYYGIALSGATTPQAGGVSLGASNLTRAPAATQHAFWGPWEVVDGTRFANPFGMPGF